MKLRPISEAPRDGTPIMIHVPQHCQLGQFYMAGWNRMVHTWVVIHDGKWTNMVITKADELGAMWMPTVAEPAHVG